MRGASEKVDKRSVDGRNDDKRLNRKREAKRSFRVMRLLNGYLVGTRNLRCTKERHKAGRKEGGETVPFDLLDQLWWTLLVTVTNVIEFQIRVTFIPSPFLPHFSDNNFRKD